MIHLRMSGRVLIADAGADRPPHTHVVMPLEERDGVHEEMWFVDPRTFGEVVVYDPAHENEVLPELSRLGVDPISEPFDADILRSALRGRRGALKPLLLGQHVVAGIGNIYADEILHRCRMRWNRAVDSLGRKHIDMLAANIVSVLSDAIDAGGGDAAGDGAGQRSLSAAGAGGRCSLAGPGALLCHRGAADAAGGC